MLPDSAQSCVKGGSKRTSSDIVVEWQVRSVGCVWVGGCVGVGVSGSSCVFGEAVESFGFLCHARVCLLLQCCCFTSQFGSVRGLSFLRFGKLEFAVVGTVTRGVGLFYSML